MLQPLSVRMIPGLVTLLGCMGVFAQSAVAADSGRDLLGIDMAKWMNDDLNHSLSLVEELKATWVRCGIAWEQIEPSPGEYDWEHLDRVVNQTRQHHLRLLVTLRAFNPWAGIRIPARQNQAHANRAATPPKDMAQFARFVGAAAARYKGRGVCWQIENEPNLGVYWLGTREEYVHLLKSAYTAIHAADLDAVVVSAGIACEFFEHLGAPQQRLARLKQWFDAVFESGAFDAIDIHDYFIPEDGNPWGITFGGYIGAVKSWMKEKGVRAPLWITEFDFPSGPLTVRQKTVSFAPDRQAGFLEQAISQARTEGVRHLFWMFMRDTEQGQGNHLGLATKDGRHKAAWNEFARLASD